MVARLLQFWKDVRSSLWFVPTLAVLGSIILAFVTIEIDTRLNGELTNRWPRLFGVSVEGARGVLSSIATSMITVVGITFSVTIVTLSLAASQYTSRVLRNFMSDRANQSVLGVFAGVFTYCLIVLRAIQDPGETGFVPSLSVMCALLLALVSVGFLIFFIHHTAASIQASSIVASVATETTAEIDRLYSEPLEDGMEESRDDDRLEQRLARMPWRTLAARRSGYVQSIDTAGLMQIAKQQRTVVRVEYWVGDFIVEGTTIASFTGDNMDFDAIKKDIDSIYTVGHYRTISEDPAYGFRQIVDMAMKALSPGINDTTTAVTCIDYLAALLARLAGRKVYYRSQYEDNDLRLVVKCQSFEKMVDLAFNQIRQNAGGNVAVLIRMITAIEIITAFTRGVDRRRVLRKHLELVLEFAERTVECEEDLRSVRARVDRVRPLVA